MRRACLPGLEGDDLRCVYFYAVLPNLLLSLHPDYVMVHTLWPRGAGRTEMVCEWLFHPDALARPDFDPQRRVRVLGSDQPAGLARLRANAARPHSRGRTAPDRIPIAKSFFTASTV